MLANNLTPRKDGVSVSKPQNRGDGVKRIFNLFIGYMRAFIHHVKCLGELEIKDGTLACEKCNMIIGIVPPKKE